MRILVFSDSHGNPWGIKEALLMHPEADVVIHLGDGERDFAGLEDLLTGKKLFQVCGNCDFASLLPPNQIVTVANTDIFCTHGYLEGVKSGTEALAAKAKNTGARIALYGHTHQSVTRYEEELHIMNPGCARLGEYGIIDITSSGIMCITARV